MLMKVSQVTVYTADMQRAVQFYRDALGFPVRFESPEWTELHSGATTLVLRLAGPGAKPIPRAQGPAAPQEPGPGSTQLGLEVLDVDKFYLEKKARGVNFVQEPAVRELGRKLAVFADPDGLLISVTEEVR